MHCAYITSGLLNILQSHLEHHRWLAAENITVADIAVYPYIALAPEGDIDIELYPAVIGWPARIQALSGYLGMPGMWVAKTSVEAVAQ
jgi:glutathione S-transferase